jgi:hypothetical protein
MHEDLVVWIINPGDHWLDAHQNGVQEEARRCTWPATCCLGLPQTRSNPRLTLWWTSEWLYHVYYYARPHLKVASSSMKAHNNCLANSVGFHEGDRIWLYCLTQTRGKLAKLQLTWEGPYKVSSGSSINTGWRWWWCTWTSWCHNLLATLNMQPWGGRCVAGLNKEWGGVVQLRQCTPTSSCSFQKSGWSLQSR